MKIAAIAFTERGGNVVKLLKDKMNADGFIIHTRPKDGLKTFASLDEVTRLAWEKYDALVFVGACGIAVRAAAPYIRNKAEDRAVVAVDEAGRYAVPLLSGHIGGANALARNVARITGGEAVITTATDINGKFAVDTFAVCNDLHIGDTKIIKEISSRVLHGEPVGLVCDAKAKNIPDIFTERADAGICISAEEKKPFDITLNLYPKTTVIGIGCRRGADNIEESALEFLRQNNISVHSLCAAATIDIKKDERGINGLCEKYSLELLTFTAAELGDTKGSFTASDFVKKTVGVDNVCERAVCAAGAELTHKKTAADGVTFALGTLKSTVDFGRGH